MIDDVEAQLQHTDAALPREERGRLHDLLLRVGDLSRDEMAARAASERGRPVDPQPWSRERRAIEVPIGGERARSSPSRTPRRYRDALGVPLPLGLPEALLEPVADPLGDLVLRYARTHGPFTTDDGRRRASGSREAAAATALAPPGRARTRAAGRRSARAGPGASGARPTCCA